MWLTGHTDKKDSLGISEFSQFKKPYVPYLLANSHDVLVNLE